MDSMKDKKTSNQKQQNSADVSILLTISRTFRTFITLIVSVIAVRWLSVQEYAIYLQIMFLLTTIVMTLSFGMPRSIYYFMPRVSNKKKFVFHSMVIINAVGLLALLILSLGRTEICRVINNDDLAGAMFFLAAYVFLSTNRQIYNSVLLSTNNGKLLAISEAILAVLIFISMVTPLFTGLGLKGILWGMLVFYVIQYFITGILSLRSVDGNFSEIAHSECLLEQFKYIIPIGLISLLAVFSQSIDRIIVTLFMSIEDFALYDRGAMRIPVISTLSITVGAVIMTKLVESYKHKKIDELMTVWHVSIEKVALIIFPCFVILAILAKQFILLLYTDKFADSVLIFRIYLIILIFTITIYGNIYNATNRNRLFLYVSIVFTVISAPMCIFMLKLFGSIGPALSTVALHLFMFVTNIVCIRKILGVKYRDVFPWFFLSKLVVCSIVSGVIPFLIVYLIDLNKITTILVSLVIYFSTYYIILNSCSLLKDEDKQTLLKWTGIAFLKKNTAT